MITNPRLLEHFNASFLVAHPLTIEQKFAILQGLYDQAVAFGHFTEKDLHEGLENDVQLSRSSKTHVQIPSR